eukprot:TRINITY_DN907_c0_g1_i2.p1 TRINITY_DN907_c0_g1~~TRINITY_DN907_c0_g1_i2.p1  ORF type:complete len:259 (+),score=45.76 TRINITY_DN907_c0_g1_i2:55-777(+)
MAKMQCIVAALMVAAVEGDPTDVVSYAFDLTCNRNDPACDAVMGLAINSTSEVEVPTLTLNVNQFPADGWDFSLNLGCHNGAQKDEVVLCNASIHNPEAGHCLVDSLDWKCPFDSVSWTLTLTGGTESTDDNARLELQGHVYICPSESCNPTPTPATPPPVPPATPSPSSSSSGWPMYVGVFCAIAIFLGAAGLIFWWKRTKGQTGRYQSSVNDVAGQEMAGEDASILRTLPAGRNHSTN